MTRLAEGPADLFGRSGAPPPPLNAFAEDEDARASDAQTASLIGEQRTARHRVPSPGQTLGRRNSGLLHWLAVRFDFWVNTSQDIQGGSELRSQEFGHLPWREARSSAPDDLVDVVLAETGACTHRTLVLRSSGLVQATLCAPIADDLEHLDELIR